MPKLGYYSWQAIQGRQQQAYNQWAASQPRPQQDEGGDVAPTDKTTPTAKTTIRPESQRGKYSIPLQDKTANKGVIPTAPKYLEQQQANIKTILGTDAVEPVYYAGKVRDGLAGLWDAAVANPFKNWARRTYANINNPYDILPASSPEQDAKVKEKVEFYKKNTEASWDYKINKFVTEDVFGLSMEDMFQTAALKDVAKEQGINTDTKEFVGSVKAAASTIAFGVLGAPEWVVRNGAAVVKGLDETADEVAGADKENVQPILDGVEKFEKAAAEGQFDYIGEVSGERLRVSAQEGKFGDIAAFAKVINSLSPVEILKDAGRLVMHLDKLPDGKLLENINREVAGSQAIYSMVYDDALHAEYVRRYENGESPQKLVLEMQNPGVELAGGLLLDPTTWLTGKTAAKVFIDEKTGARVIQEGIKSASLAAIDNGLLDVRMVKEVKNAVESISKVAEGTTPKTQQEALDVIQSAFKITKETMDTWKNRRGITSLTSSAKQSLVIEQTTDFFRDLAARAADHPDGMDVVTGTVDAMITLAKGEGDTAKAFTTLINSPLGQAPLSPRGMRVANMLAGIDEITPAIQKAIDAKDVKGLANLYADKLEQVTKKTILSVEEMRGAADDVTKITKQISEAAGDAKKVENLTAKLNDAKAIAKQYNDLPAVAKFVNGANELGKKTWLKPMKLFSELYFGLNRFSYPLRNVFSTIPGMAYEFGLSEALEIAGKGITGAQIEKIGVQTLQSISGEIEKLVGFVPEAFKRGATPVGEFLNTDKKYFGVLRGGGEVAALSEQLMGAQIMYKTIKREMRNALKNGVIPDTRALEAAGLGADDAKKLVQYTLEHNGEVGKIVDDFRKFMGGTEETFRHIAVPEKMTDFLDSLGSGTKSPVKDIVNLQKTAKSADEFRTGVQKIWEDTAVKFGEVSRSEPVNLSDDIPADFVDDIKKAQMFKYASEEVLNNFERVLQGWRNSEASMLDASKQMMNWFRNNGVDTGAYMTDVISVTSKKYVRQDAVRNLVRKVYEARETLTSQQMWDELESLEDFKISKMTELDPKKANPAELVKVMWDAYFRWSGEQRAAFAVAHNDGLSEILSKMASQIGTDLPTAAKMADIPYQKAVDDFNYAKDLYKESKIDSMIAIRRKVKPSTTLQDIDIASIKQAGYKSQSHLFNDINKYRRAQGLEPYQAFNQVNFWEVEDQVRRFKGAQGLIPDLSGETAQVTKTVGNVVPDISKPAQAIPMETVIKQPRSDLPNYVSKRFEETAKFLKSQLLGGEAGKRSAAGSFGTTNVDWYRELSAKLKLTKPALEKALDKIVQDAGKDKGVNVERMKEMILDIYRYGDEGTGTPPDLFVLQQLGVDDKVMQEALDEFNIITKSDLTLEEAISKSLPDFMKASDSAVATDFTAGADYFDEAGNLITAKYVPRKHPPISPDKPVTPSRMVFDSLDKAKHYFDEYVDNVASRWGETSAPVGALDDGIEKALGSWVETLTKQVNQAKTEAAVAAQATRDAMLYDYRKQLWNVAAQYVSPFHYFHASASKQWLQNVAADPKWGAIYIDYKEYMAQRHAGLPDFWKQNVSVSGLPGYDKDNPLFFNIEASVNPLYQMIGSDFNDPNRRKDWLSTTVDDLSKVIPGLYQPLQWVVAANLARQGEADAAKRWAGRLIPQTKIFKSVTNAMGIDIPLTKYNEVDPFVSIFSDGLDPFEEGRVNRYLSTMPGVSEEAKIQAAQSRSGDLWEQAVRGSLSARAPVEAASYFLGVGYKPRTAADIKTDQFYEDYRKLIAARSIMPEQEYRDAWDALRTKHPYMDALLIGRKGGDDRDTAFAYNVLGRIPPSEMTDIARFVHVEPYMIESFYSNKGDLSKMLPQDRDRFMAAIVDLSAMLKMPDGATKQEWSLAKNTYKEMQSLLQKEYGDNILDQISQFYELPENSRQDYLDTFPEVEAAMAAQNAYVAKTPILSAYYNGIDATARYYNSKVYIQLDKEFGNDIQDKADFYYYLTQEGKTKEANAYKKQYNLKAYFDRKDKLQQEANLAAINAARDIPDGKDYAIRPSFQPQSGIQENAYQYTQGDQRAQMASDIYAQLSAPMKALLQDYYNGKNLPYVVGKRLEYLGQDYGLSKQEVLRILGIEESP